ELPVFGDEQLPDAELADLVGLAQADGAIPKRVYRLPRQQLAEFLDRLIVDANPGDVSVLSSESKRFVLGVQHLLVRFGIATVVQPADAGHELVLSAADRAQLGMVVGARELVAAGSGTRIARYGGGSWCQNAQAGANVFWDEIVEISYDGEEQVYDLTVPGDHNFVAGDVFVHNTSMALGMAAHAAVKCDPKHPVLFFSLEMSHLELTRRLLCAEARVDATRLRTGRLVESDWTKISHAVGRLAEA